MSTNVPNLKQIGGGHRKNGQKFVDLMWNDPITITPNIFTTITRGVTIRYTHDTIRIAILESRYDTYRDTW